MSRTLFVTLISALLIACASHAVALNAVTLPMPAPPMPARDVPKDQPMPVGVSVTVPDEAGVIDPSRLSWSDGVARVTVEWPQVSAFRLQLLAEGTWSRDTRVRVLDSKGTPLHIDTWSPAGRSRWWSAVGDGCCMVIEISGRPPRGAMLRIVAADALGEPR